MKKSKIWLLIGTIIILFVGQNVNAHTISGFTGESEEDVKRYAVTCYPNEYGNTQKYSFNVTFKSSLDVGLKLTVTKAGESNEFSVETLKPGVTSPTGTNPGGDGPYVLTISKIRLGSASAVGKVGFEIDEHCLSANDGHTGTSDAVDISSSVNPPVPKQPAATGSASGFSAALNNKVESRRYKVECMGKKGVDTQGYRFRIRGVSKKAPFNARMKVSIEGSEVVEITDPINADKNFSEWREVGGGNNTYFMTIDKVSEINNTSGTLPFKVQHECVSEAGSRTSLKKFKKLP